jgi:hypothetical protein
MTTNNKFPSHDTIVSYLRSHRVTDPEPGMILYQAAKNCVHEDFLTISCDAVCIIRDLNGNLRHVSIDNAAFRSGEDHVIYAFEVSNSSEYYDCPEAADLAAILHDLDFHKDMAATIHNLLCKLTQSIIDLRRTNHATTQ